MNFNDYIFAKKRAGSSDGGSYEQGYEAGKQAEYIEWWTEYQRYGYSSYYGRFSGYGWTNKTFKPPFNINASGSAQAIFQNSRIEGDLVEILNNLDISMNFKDITSWAYSFYGTYFTRLGSFEFGDITISYTFANNAYLKTIDELIVTSKTKYSNVFGTTNLENLTISGTIGQNGFDVKSSTDLSKASNISIINALSTTTSGLTVTLSLTAVNKAFETSPGANDGSTSEEWLNLVATKPNWTVALA